MKHYLTPVEVLERLIGPFSVLAPIAGLDEKSLYGWKRESAIRQAGDLPSANIMRKFLKHARRTKLPLKPEWLIEGAKADEVIRLQEQLQNHKVAAE